MLSALSELPGYRTYAVAALAALSTFLKAMGWMTEEHWQTLMGILGPLLAVFLRMGSKADTK